MARRVRSTEDAQSPSDMSVPPLSAHASSMCAHDGGGVVVPRGEFPALRSFMCPPSPWIGVRVSTPDIGVGAPQAFLPPGHTAAPPMPDECPEHPGVQPPDGHVLATILPYKGVINVDEDIASGPGVFVISHALTGERSVLNEVSQLHIEYDDEGSGILFARRRGDAEYIPIEKLLPTPVYSAGEDERFVVDDTFESSEGLVPLNALRRRFQIIDVSFKAGPQKLGFTVAAALFPQPAWGGQRLAWSLHHLYDCLGLDTCRGQRWTWVAKFFDRWRSCLLKMYPEHDATLIARSQQEAWQVQASGEDFERMLPWPSVATVGLLALLVRFGLSPSPRSGRLTSPDAQAVAETMFLGLLDPLRHHSWDLALFIDAKVELRWPRPHVGGLPVRYLVLKGLMLDFSSGRRLGQDPARCDHEWAKSAGLDISALVSLTVVLKKLLWWDLRARASKLRDALVSQIILALAQQLDTTIASAHTAGAAGALVSTSDRTTNTHDATVKELPKELLLYWQS